MLLDSIEDFLIDMEEIKLPKELRDQLISLKADITDFLNEWANVVGPDEPPDGVPVACATDMCACGHHGVSHCQAGCAICNCSKFEEA